MVPICSKKRKKSLAFLKVCIRGNFAESVRWVFSHFTKVSRSVCAHGSGNNVFSSRGTDFMFGIIRLIDLWDRGEEFLWNTKWNTSPDRFRHNYSSGQTNEHGGGIWPGYIESSLGMSDNYGKVYGLQKGFTVLFVGRRRSYEVDVLLHWIYGKLL